MPLQSSLITYLLVAITFSHAANTLRVRDGKQTPLQTSLQRNTRVPIDAEADIFHDSQVDKELFWALTTSDAAPSLDRMLSLDLKSRSQSIVLDNHIPGKAKEPAASQSEEEDVPASLQISMSTIGGFPIYHTPIAIGNPAQPFRAWLNLNLNGLYVRSAACSKSDCGRGFTYDQTKSTTRKSSGKRFEVHPKDWTVGGTISTDTLHLVSVPVDNATVGEIDRYEGEDLFYYVMEFVVDGALGLAPPNKRTLAYSPLLAPNPLQDLVRSHALKHNTLTLTLPRNTNDVGSLKLGLPPRTKDGTLRIPISNASGSSVGNRWHVSLDAVSLDGTSKLHIPMESAYGRLDLEPAIRLPPSTTKAIYEAVGAKPGSLFYGATIDCRARTKLPDLVLNIGGNDVRLAKDDYSSEQMVYDHPVCVVAILPSEGEDVAVIGTNVLRKYHVMVDMDRNELGLTPRATSSG